MVERLAAYGLTLVGLFCMAKALPGYLAGGLASLLAPALLVGVLSVLVAVGARSAGRSFRTHRFRMNPGGAPKVTIKHEVAHAEVGNRHGGRTVAGAVYADGSGWVDVRLPASASLAQHVAVDMAGAIGEGACFWSSPHAAGDRANAAARVAHLPPNERDRIYREAAGMATPGWSSGSAAGLRRALETTGRYH